MMANYTDKPMADEEANQIAEVVGKNLGAAGQGMMFDCGNQIGIAIVWPDSRTAHRWDVDTPNLVDKATAYFRQWFTEKHSEAA